MCFVAGQVEEAILEKTGVSVRQNESVAVEEVRSVRRISHHVPPQGYSDGSHPNRTSGFISMDCGAISRLRACETYPG
jgi:hypothetical protein